MENRTHQRLTHGEWEGEGNLWIIGPDDSPKDWDREGNLWEIGPKQRLTQEIGKERETYGE